MQLIRANDDHACGTCGPFFVLVWRRETWQEDVEHGSTALHAFAARAGRKVHLMQVIEPRALAPSKQARDALGDMLRSASQFVEASSVVHEGTGFHASLARGVVTGLVMLARPGYPHQVFASVEAAMASHAAYASQPLGVTVGQVVYAVNDLRGAIDVATAASA